MRGERGCRCSISSTEAAAGGVDAIYLRDAGGSIDDLALTARTLRAQIGDEVALLVNGGPQAALATGSGLHLRERDMTPAAARAVLGPAVLIGRSVHTPEGAAAATGADYVLAGHVYPSPSKPGLPPLGPSGLARIVAVAPCPVIAIGGITPDRVAGGHPGRRARSRGDRGHRRGRGPACRGKGSACRRRSRPTASGGGVHERRDQRRRARRPPSRSSSTASRSPFSPVRQFTIFLPASG